MKTERSIKYVVGFLFVGFLLWRDILAGLDAIDIGFYSLAFLYLAVHFIFELFHWKETRPKLLRIIDICLYAALVIVFATMLWRWYTSEFAVIPFLIIGGYLLLLGCGYLLALIFNWEEKRPDLFRYLKYGLVGTLFVIILVMAYVVGAYVVRRG